ncbi:MAG TPA: hypothetical protein VJG83_06740 [archaeon]|nr:hypothetical protein [archaeon]
MSPATSKKIYEFLLVNDFLKSVAGDYAVELVKICANKKKPATDEEIGKKLPLKVTEIRTILNRLHYRGIACYQKTKNNKTGWYSYTWEIKNSRIAEILLEQQAEQIEKLEHSMEFEGSHEFYSGGKGCQEYPFEIAAEYNFKDPESGKALALVDNKKRLKELTKKMDTLKMEVEELRKIL